MNRPARWLCPLRILLLLLASAPVAVLLVPAPVAAQLPSEDHEDNLGQWMMRGAGHFADWYAQAVEWRNAAISKSREMKSQTDRLVAQRRHLERRAAGEMGKLGDYVPDWKEGSSVCAIEHEGESVCTSIRNLSRKYEGMVTEWVDERFSDLYSVRDSVSLEIEQFMGGYFERGEEWASNALEETAFANLFLKRPMMEERAHTYSDMEALGLTLNTVLDEMNVEELEEEGMSSGRAFQLQAYLSVLEAEAEVEILEARLRALDLEAVSAADQIVAIHRGHSGVIRGLRSW